MKHEFSPEQFQKIIEYANSFDIERNNRWVNASIKVTVFHPYLQVTVQGLGKLDAKLIKEDTFLFQQGTPSNPLGDMNDHITLSYLWILGAYEIIRALDQRARNDTNFLIEDKDKLTQLKQRFGRLRMPLAKFEPAKKHSDTDSPIAFPGFNSQLGTSWKVSQDIWITRRELSDSMLELFESISL